MGKKSILFDVDGVLLDTMSIWANSANLCLSEIYGIDAPPELDKACATMSLLEAGEYIRQLYPQISQSAAELADEVAECIRERYWKAPEMPGMIHAVRKLQENGYTLYLATASNRENVRGALSNLGVWDCFTDIFTCTDIGYSKSYKEFYDEIAKRIEVACTDLIMIEDSLYSMITAKQAGLTVVGMYEASSKDQEEEIRKVCDVYLKNLLELPEWLLQFGG